MKWNTAGTSTIQFQKTRTGTARAHTYYFVMKYGATYVAGYRGYGRDIMMESAGTFLTAQEARAYVEKYDREAVIITSQTA